MEPTKIKLSPVEITFLVVVIFIAGFIFNNWLNEKDVNTISKVEKLDLPPNGEINYFTLDEPIAPLKIKSDKNTNYFIKLVEKNTKETAVTIFLHGGNQVETKVPLGLYEFRYASGNNWYGEERLFGTYTTYFKADKELEFFITDDNVIMGHTLELIKQRDGNMQTYNIGKQQF